MLQCLIWYYCLWQPSAGQLVTGADKNVGGCPMYTTTKLGANERGKVSCPKDKLDSYFSYVSGA